MQGKTKKTGCESTVPWTGRFSTPEGFPQQKMARRPPPATALSIAGPAPALCSLLPACTQRETPTQQVTWFFLSFTIKKSCPIPVSLPCVGGPPTYGRTEKQRTPVTTGRVFVCHLASHNPERGKRERKPDPKAWVTPRLMRYLASWPAFARPTSPESPGTARRGFISYLPAGG